MSDNQSSVGTIATIVALVGACSLCALGPALLVSLLAGATRWFTELSPMIAVGLVLIVVFVAHRLWCTWGVFDKAHSTETNQGNML